MKISNKDVIQSYILTVAKYGFSVYEKRVLYRLVEMIQFSLEGNKLDKYFSIEKTLFDDRIITMPISAFLLDEDDENYTRIKQALTDLRNKTFEFEDGKEWKLIGIIEKPKFFKAGYVRFEVQPEVYLAILNFSKGFRKYELKTAMSFESIYSMRFYELFSNQKRPITYTIDNLKIMFKIEDKYKDRPHDFIKKVIQPAQKELNEKSPYSFEYRLIKQGRKITSIGFHPVYIAKNRDENLEKKNLQKQVSPSWELDKITINYLKENYLFTTEEIKNNIDLFKESESKLDILLELSSLKRKAQNANNPQGYVISSLRKMLANLNNQGVK